jgi:chromosome partitioning protein
MGQTLITDSQVAELAVPPTSYNSIAALDKLRYRASIVARMLDTTPVTVAAWEKELSASSDSRLGTVPSNGGHRLYSIQNVFDLANRRRSSALFHPIVRKEKSGPVVVASYVIKGGAAKSTTAVETASQLQLLGYKCLVIDLDQQGSASFMCGLEPELETEDAELYNIDPELVIRFTFQNLFEIPPFFDKKTIGSPIQTYAPLKDVLKKPFGDNGIHIIPADINISTFDFALNSANNRETKIKSLIESGRKGENPDFDISGYDFVFFDCPPQINIKVRAALIAADIVIAPLRLDELSKKGLSLLSTELTIAGKEFNVWPKVFVVPTFFSQHVSRMSDMFDWAKGLYQSQITNAIRQSEELPKNLPTHVPLSFSKPTAPVVIEDYRELAKFMVANINGTTDLDTKKRRNG